MIYIAAPYSHPEPIVRTTRYRKVTELTAALLRLGHMIFSPLTYSVPMAEEHGLPGDWGFWERLDTAFLTRCDEFWIYTLPGWESSVGVAAERQIAERLMLPVAFVSEDEARGFVLRAAEAA